MSDHTQCGGRRVEYTLSGSRLRVFVMRVLFAVLLCFALAGCSIHPLPDDVTRDSTFDIVEKIRCEARDAIATELLILLDRSSDPGTRALVPELKSGRLKFADLEEDQVDDRTLSIIDQYRWAGIGFKFTFQISENNDASGSALFKMPFTDGTFSLAVAAGKDKSRQNRRVIDIGDSFEGLVVGREDACATVEKPGKNWKHPITGNIGLAEVVHTYTRLVGNNEKVGEFSDELQYTVRAFGSVTPSVSLSKFEHKVLRLASASARLSADRTDTHRVKIAFIDVRSVPAAILKKRRAGRALRKRRLASRRAAARRVRGRSTRVFNSSPDQTQFISNRAVQELRRLDSLDRQQRLNDLIGR